MWPLVTEANRDTLSSGQFPRSTGKNSAGRARVRFERMTSTGDISLIIASNSGKAGGMGSLGALHQMPVERSKVLGWPNRCRFNLLEDR